MKYLSAFLLLFLLAACNSSESKSEDISSHTPLENPFIHTAYFWLKEDVSDMEKAAFIRDCEKLAEVETVRAFYSGSPANTDRDVIENTYDYAVVFHFENLDDQEVYQQHPLHLEMIEKHQEKWERVMVTDIEHYFQSCSQSPFDLWC